ncbi:MAG: hypothetical protein IPP79_01720 [Chitinophagaceae bacterium]|nr:hypothetical protein [Chitinophagaceae bacterium]
MKAKCIAVWMDHASAQLMELTSGEMDSKIIVSEFTNEEKRETLQKGNKTTHNKEQRETHAFYKEIIASIKDYEEVLLFGPTDAKTELYNILKEDHHFDKVNVEARSVDRMTENQKHAFVKEYFYKHLVPIE